MLLYVYLFLSVYRLLIYAEDASPLPRVKKRALQTTGGVNPLPMPPIPLFPRPPIPALPPSLLSRPTSSPITQPPTSSPITQPSTSSPITQPPSSSPTLLPTRQTVPMIKPAPPSVPPASTPRPNVSQLGEDSAQSDRSGDVATRSSLMIAIGSLVGSIVVVVTLSVGIGKHLNSRLTKDPTMRPRDDVEADI